MTRNPAVDDYLSRATHFQAELAALLTVVRECGLDETIKWGSPCFTWQGRNVVGVAAFKRYFGLWFHQGALLQDPAGVLVNAQPGRTRAQRQWRMTALHDIDAVRIRAYLREAKALAEAGREVAPVRDGAIEIPEPLAAALAADPAARTAFDALRPGLRREYAAHVADARREATRQRRIVRILPMIKAGVGLNDRYRR